jgi:ATP-dependent Clp protease ATP-binding subunit ClpA
VPPKAIDAASILKPALARRAADDRRDDARRVPQVPERDAALERRFQRIRVDEPSTDDTVQIQRGSATATSPSPVQITDGAEVAVLADRHIRTANCPTRST